MKLYSQTRQYSYRWVILGLTTICLLVYAGNFYAPAPVLSLIINDFDLSYTQAGSLMSFFSLPGIAISIPIGLIADRSGPKKVGTVSLVLMSVGAAINVFSGNFLVLILGRIMQGIGTFSLGVISAQLLSQWFSGKEMGLAMGVYNAAMPLGVIIWFNIVSLLGVGRAWQQYLLVGLLANLVLMALFILFSREREECEERKVVVQRNGLFGLPSSIKAVGTPIWLVAFAWLWFNAALVSFLTFTPDFFIERGYGEGLGSMVSSSVMWFSVPLCPIIGRIIDRVDGKAAFIGGSAVAMSLVMFLIPFLSSGHLILLIIMGLTLPFIPTAIYAMLPDVVGPQKLGLGFGIIFTCMNIAIVLGPLLVGFIRDVSGSYSPTFVLMAGFAVLIVPPIFGLQRRQQTRDLRY